MAEIKITCPCCLDSKQCFEEKVDIENFSSFICFNCGFMSNTLYTNDSAALKKLKESTSELMNEISFYDYDRKIHWFPTILNMGEFGMIYPEGTKDNWVYKLAQVRPLTELEKKDEKYNGHTEMLDVEKAETFGQYEFLEACQKMGIIKELD